MDPTKREHGGPTVRTGEAAGAGLLTEPAAEGWEFFALVFKARETRNPPFLRADPAAAFNRLFPFPFAICQSLHSMRGSASSSNDRQTQSFLLHWK